MRRIPVTKLEGLLFRLTWKMTAYKVKPRRIANGPWWTRRVKVPQWVARWQMRILLSFFNPAPPTILVVSEPMRNCLWTNVH